jgi:membrane associated rhomboid family serine protease
MLFPIGDNLERPSFPVATVMLIFINVAAFVITSRLELTGDNLIDTGERAHAERLTEVKEFYNVWGCVPVLLQEGQLIGVLTHMFLHGSIFHLIGNMIILWVFGQSLETALGGLTFSVFYVFWGVVACLTHCAMDFSSEVFLIGASGAIAGVMGGYMCLFGFTAKIRMLLLLGPLPVTFFVPAGGFGFLWIMQQMYNASIDVEGSLTGVAWMAHVGGFMGGLATIWIFRNTTEQVLIRDGQRLYFGKRSQVSPAGDADPEAHLNIDLDDESTFVDIRPRPCQYCGCEITKENLISERLLRCPNRKCEQLTYLTAEEVQPSYVE